MITSLIRRLQRCKYSIPEERVCLTESPYVFYCLFLNKIASLAVIATSCIDVRLTIGYPADTTIPTGSTEGASIVQPVGGIALGIGDYLLAVKPKYDTPD